MPLDELILIMLFVLHLFFFAVSHCLLNAE